MNRKINLFRGAALFMGLFSTTLLFTFQAVADSPYCDLSNYDKYITSKKKVERLIEETDAGCNFVRVDFSNGDWNNTYLMKADLTGSVMKYAKFHDADFSGADFTTVNAYGVEFNGAHLPGADFTMTNLDSSNFQDAQLPGASFYRASLGLGSTFEGADLTGAAFVDVEFVSFKSINFFGTTLEQVYFSGGHHSDLIFITANLSNAIVEDIRFYKTEFTKANLSGAIFKDVDFERSNFINTNFSNSHLEDVVITTADFKNSNFTGATLKDVKLLGRAILTGANFEGATIQGLDFRGLDLRRTRNLNFVASITDSKYDASTQFPEGFNPANHGMTFIEPPVVETPDKGQDSAKREGKGHVPPTPCPECN